MNRMGTGVADGYIADNIAYIAGCDEIFRGIRISDGKEVLNMPAGGYTGASPTIVGNIAYFGNKIIYHELPNR